MTKHPSAIRLGEADLFRVIRGLMFAAFKSMRGISDAFGDELRLQPESCIGDEPLSMDAAELRGAADKVARFFSLGESCTRLLCSASTPGEWTRIVHDLWAGKPEFVSFDSSGSTGTPKSIKRDFCFIEQDAFFLASLIEGARRIVSLVPAHHIYGFIFSVLIPRALGLGSEDKRFLSPGAVMGALLPGDVLIATPLHWKLFTRSVARFPESCQGVTSTAPCPAEVIKLACSKGLCRLTEIYGSSESGAMGYRSDPDTPFSLLPTWQRAESESFTRHFPDGTLSEPFHFQDRLEWVDENRFRVAGRIDEAVQIAGINVYPGKVAEIIRRHDAVGACAVRLMRPEEGDRFKAFVVLKSGLKASHEVKRALQEYILKHLSHIEQPKAITFGRRLPQNGMGKLTDW